MKKYTQTSRNLALLLAGVSSIGLLAGCSTTIRNPFFNERPPQVVSGGRHAPLLNGMKPSMVTNGALGAPDTAPTSAMSVPPQDPMAASMPDGAKSPMAHAAKKDEMIRKPIPGNPYGAAGASNQPTNTSVAGAPVSGNAQQVKVIYEPNQAGAAKQPSGAVADIQPAPPVYAASEEVVYEPRAKPPMEKPSFFSRLFNWSSSEKEEAATNHEGLKSEEMEGNASAPSLSSVPATPSEFKDIRASSQQRISDMQDENARAMQEKSAINGELSHQQNPGQEVVSAPRQAEPKPQPKLQPEIQHSSPPQFGNQVEWSPAPAEPAPLSGVMNEQPPVDQSLPHTPRRGIDIMTQEQWDAMQKMKMSTPVSPPAGDMHDNNQSQTLGPRSDAESSDSVWQRLASALSLVSEAYAADEERRVPVLNQVGISQTKDMSATVGDKKADAADGADKKIVAEIKDAPLAPGEQLPAPLSDEGQQATAAPVIENEAPPSAADVHSGRPLAPLFSTAPNRPKTGEADNNTAASAKDAKKEEEPVAEETSSDKSSFFSRLFGGSAPSESTEAPIETASVPAAETAPSAAYEANVPAIVKAEAKSAAPAAGAATPAEATKVELPSPKILEEVKMLPPSRYSARARSLSSNPVSN